MLSDTLLTAAFEDMLKAQAADESRRLRCRALDTYLTRSHDYLWAAQQEEDNRHREKPET